MLGRISTLGNVLGTAGSACQEHIVWHLHMYLRMGWIPLWWDLKSFGNAGAQKCPSAITVRDHPQWRPSQQPAQGCGAVLLSDSI